jgi:D-amino peptidase
MKVLIAADMEGITGVVHWDQVSLTHPEYARFRKLMTQDVNAAIRGAFDAGADELVVTDGHAWGRNILLEDLDPRARLNSGALSFLSMVQGVDQGVDGVLYVGYHARIGAPQATLEHTWSDERVFGLWLNSQLHGEPGLNAAVCGHFDVPVVMVSGDQAVCDECLAMLGDVETAVVKRASGRMAAELLPPAATQELIEQAAWRAVTRLVSGAAPAPYRLTPPIHMAIEFVQSEMADKAMLMPGALRAQDRRVEYTADDMLTIYRAFRTLLALAR